MRLGDLLLGSLAAVPLLMAQPPRPPGAPIVYGEPGAEISESVAPGILFIQHGFKRGGVPFTLQVLDVDPSNPAINILPVHAKDHAIGKETTSSIAKRYGATAAVNGGFFIMRGNYEGASTGVYELNRRVLASGDARTALLWCAEHGYRERAAVSPAPFKGSISAKGGWSMAVAGVNRERKEGELVVYTPEIGASTPALGAGLEVTLDSEGRVTAVKDGRDAAAVPVGGFVLSASGKAAGELRAHAEPGMKLRVRLQLVPTTKAGRACRATDIIGAGPRLVSEGRVAVTEEGFDHAKARHPRTAFAVTREGHFLFLTLDGRQASSAGMTLDELAAELVAMGAAEAINLDGGGSTTVVVHDKIRNSPSDKRERPVSDAILMYSLPDVDALVALVRSLKGTQIEPELAARFEKGLIMGRYSKRKLGAMARLAEQSVGHGISDAAARVVSEAARSIAAK